MDEIEKRMVLKAGNTPAWKNEEPPVKAQEKAPETVKEGKYGTGLTAGDVDRIAANFLRDISRG
jgi:hypothetical protein